MSKQLELRLSGSGGQGLITAGIILAEAALKDNMNAIQTQSYGPEARGGASKAEVIISDAAIDFPKVTLPTMTLALTQIASDKYIGDISEEGTIIVDDTIQLPEGIKAKNIYKIPIIKTAVSEVGKEIVANIVALGLIVGLTGIVSEESLEQAIMSRIPKGTEDLNRLALKKGYELAKNI
ncbi:2-oxoacid:acceptor oxidoreductase family protein [Fusibacter bizertensis]|uniref:2-oxoacid:acceptor oxidoreductase family protein n=1 Tax=Fusibacter bizertensis TaxID=1488331 RepID=A0ABT6N9G3_9FIRM|nr:2-oxoacid:acceptor oxidoreductase family protein [Fusibacter bizertensis]MDH8677058.1 2-oxoacid:acceptor oxidoreductase family protein [Fusibacter bizertensis]